MVVTRQLYRVIKSIMSMMAEAGKLKAAWPAWPACAGANHDVLGMPAGARMGSVPTIDYDVIPEGMSAQPALFLHWEPNWARSSITILNSTCLIFGSENPQI